MDNNPCVNFFTRDEHALDIGCKIVYMYDPDVKSYTCTYRTRKVFHTFMVNGMHILVVVVQAFLRFFTEQIATEAFSPVFVLLRLPL